LCGWVSPAQVLDDLIHPLASQLEPAVRGGLANSENHGRFRNAVLLDVAKQEYLATTSAQLHGVHQHGLHHSQWHTLLRGGSLPLNFLKWGRSQSRLSFGSLFFGVLDERSKPAK
jgi:hypothetical protein